MDRDEVKQIVLEALGEFFARGEPKSSDAPPCVYCQSTATRWMGVTRDGKGRRMLCPTCGRTKTIRPGGGDG
jgi:hypothetical protein